MSNQKALKINDAVSSKGSQLIQAIRKPENNPLKIRKFVFSFDQSAKKVSKGKYTTWTPPRIVTGKTKYIEYYYAIPEGLPIEVHALHQNKPIGTMERFRIKQGINKRPSAEKSQAILESVLSWLEAGNSPFKEEIAELERLKALEEAMLLQQKKLVTVNAAVDSFINSYTEEAQTTMRVPLNILKKYFTLSVPLEESLWYKSIESVTEEELKEFMLWGSLEKGWKPLTYNDKIGKLVTFFNHCMDKKYLSISPATALVKIKKGTTVRHTPFSDEQIKIVKPLYLSVPKWGKHLSDFCEFIYYTCTRPDKETRRLQVKHILSDRHLVNIPNEIAKREEGRFIYMVPELENLIARMKLNTYPSDFYIFGKDGPPGPVPTSESHYSNLFRTEVREKHNLPTELTNYSWKHTRCIHLYEGGATVAAIQQLCGHAKPSMTEEYLSKGLGLRLGNITHSVQRSF